MQVKKITFSSNEVNIILKALYDKNQSINYRYDKTLDTFSSLSKYEDTYYGSLALGYNQELLDNFCSESKLVNLLIEKICDINYEEDEEYDETLRVDCF